VWKEIVADLV